MILDFKKTSTRLKGNLEMKTASQQQTRNVVLKVIHFTIVLLQNICTD